MQFTEINTLYEGDNDYAYDEGIVTSEQIKYYYLYLKENMVDDPIYYGYI